MVEELTELLADEYPDWEVVDDALLICPHGNQIEWDGRCPDGCVSPVIQMGLI